MGYYYGDHYSDFANTDDTAAILILLIVSVVMLFAFAIALALYLLKAFGLYRMAKNLGVKNAGLAFVPLVGDYILGKVAETPFDGKKPMRFGMILLLLNIASFVLGGAFGFYSVVMDIVDEVVAIDATRDGMTGAGIAGYMVGYLATMAISIVFAVFYYIALYRIFKMFASDNTVLFLILSIFINGAVNVLLFILRNKPAALSTQGRVAPPVGTPGYNPAYGEGNYNPFGYGQSNYTPSGDWNYQQSSTAVTGDETEEKSDDTGEADSVQTEETPTDSESSGGVDA